MFVRTCYVSSIISPATYTRQLCPRPASQSEVECGVECSESALQQQLLSIVFCSLSAFNKRLLLFSFYYLLPWLLLCITCVYFITVTCYWLKVISDHGINHFIINEVLISFSPRDMWYLGNEFTIRRSAYYSAGDGWHTDFEK